MYGGEPLFLSGYRPVILAVKEIQIGDAPMTDSIRFAIGESSPVEV